MPTPKIRLNPQQQAAAKFIEAHRRALAAGDRLLLSLVQADTAWPGKLGPARQPGNDLLTATYQALDADDQETAIQLLRAELADQTTNPAVDRPRRRRRLSEMAYLMCYAQII